MNKVTNPLPNFQLHTGNWPYICHLQLADHNCHASNEVDILLGADIFAQLMYGAPIYGKAK